MKRTLILSLAAASAWTLAGETLENGALRIEFADAARGYNVERIVNRLAGDVSFGAPTKSFVRFWMLDFCATEGGSNVTVSVSNTRPAAARTCDLADGVATFKWRGMDLPGEPGVLDVAVRVRLREGAPLSEWTIQTKNRSRKWALAKTVFPALTRLVSADDPTAKVLVPYKNVGGQLYTAAEWAKTPIGTNFQYPSCRLQMCALLKGEAGLYFAAHDPEGHIKTFVVAKDATAWCEAPVADAGVVGKAASGPGFSVTVGAFRGDWYAAAHLYRDWALRQKWAAKGPIARRPDFPKRAAETQIWIIGGGRTNSAARCFAGMDRVWPDVGKALTWSEWTEKSGGRATNRGDPEFFPAYPGLGELARKEAKAGYLVFPYVNARIWDVSTAGFAYAVRDATKRPDGAFYEEKYKDGYGVWNRFAVMCPWCPTWQKVVTQLAVRCLDELGMNGVYFDQVSCSPAKLCSDAAHGHPLGGGSWWTDGYRKMFTEIKREFVRRDAIVVSEQLGEMWLDLIDVYLNATKYESHDVPLFPAVYQGYCIHYGRAVPLDLPPREAFREHARTLVWGEAFGWISPGVPMYATYGERQKLLREMAIFRKKHAEFLVFGSLEGDLVIAGTGPKLMGTDPKISGDRPQIDGDRPHKSVGTDPELVGTDPDVFGTVWKDVDGVRRCAFAVNASEGERCVSVRWPGEKTVREVTLPARSVMQIAF